MMSDVKFTLRGTMIWKLIMVVGAASILYASVYDTAPEGTHNIGLMQTQMLFFAFGSLLFLVGAILYAVERAVKELKLASRLTAE